MPDISLCISITSSVDMREKQWEKVIKGEEREREREREMKPSEKKPNQG